MDKIENSLAQEIAELDDNILCLIEERVDLARSADKTSVDAELRQSRIDAWTKRLHLSEQSIKELLDIIEREGSVK